VISKMQSIRISIVAGAIAMAQRPKVPPVSGLRSCR
jgi:hypothetical protein